MISKNKFPLSMKKHNNEITDVDIKYFTTKNLTCLALYMQEIE